MSDGAIWGICARAKQQDKTEEQVTHEHREGVRNTLSELRKEHKGLKLKR